MNCQKEKLASTLIVSIILLGLVLTNMPIAFSDDTAGKIDLFTQKEPYSGKGPNAPSDAFGPEDVVTLYASVTYNGIPVQDQLVAFSLMTPKNASFSFTAKTNSSGIAMTSFTMLAPSATLNESEFFGKWLALANVLLSDTFLEDTLIFQVDWVVKLISSRAIDGNLMNRTFFGLEGDVGLEITLRSIAMSTRSASLAIVAKDTLGVPVNYSSIDGFEVQPNGKLIFLYAKLHIPTWAYVGNATIFVSAFTRPVSERGTPYCPEISANFFITGDHPLNISLHDAAVIDATPSVKLVKSGQTLNVSVAVRNEGTEVESFNVSTYFGGVITGTLEATMLQPYSKKMLNFIIDTSSFVAANYTIAVSIPPLLNEADLTDNVFVDGGVTVLRKMTFPVDLNGDGVIDIRDIAIAAKAFGSYPGHPRWNSIADVNNDGKVNIIDLVIIAKNFGADP